jgi:orotidine-5'-phosphate decarboxylase
MNAVKICLALDGLSAEEVILLTNELKHRVYAVKAHDLLDVYGPPIIKQLMDVGAPRVWIDHKVHDTPDTVGRRIAAHVHNGAQIITVHASGGVPMMKAAVQATHGGKHDAQAEIWAITVLTSLDDNEIKRIYGADRTRDQIVLEFALMAQEAGVRTIVCSAQEVGTLSRNPLLEGMQFTVPGTRSAGVALGQQKRSGTPEQAATDGATFLVAGSQVTQSVNPLAAFSEFAAKIAL